MTKTRPYWILLSGMLGFLLGPLLANVFIWELTTLHITNASVVTDGDVILRALCSVVATIGTTAGSILATLNATWKKN